jgi:alpha-glucosidase
VFHTPAWTYDKVRDQCYLHQFTPEQPDLNYRNKEVYNNMIEILEYWLKEGADGFRIDAINHLFEVDGLFLEEYIDPNGDKTSYDNLIHKNTMNQPESYEFIYDVREMMDKFVQSTEDKVTRLMMTEAYATVEEQVKWYGASETRQGAQFPFNFALIATVDKDSDAEDFRKAVYSWVKCLKFEK